MPAANFSIENLIVLIGQVKLRKSQAGLASGSGIYEAFMPPATCELVVGAR